MVRMKNRRVRVVMTGPGYGRLAAAARKLKMPVATLGALVLEGIAGGYSNKLGFSVKERRAAPPERRFVFRVLSRGTFR
jgi:hypothetical protein